MGECLQIGARFRVGEHDIAQRRTVEVPIGCQDRATEALDETLERRLSRLDHVTRELVSADDRHSQCAEKFCGRGFAAGDAAGEAYAERSASHLVRYFTIAQ